MSQAELLSPSPVVPSFPPLSYQGVPVLTTEMLAQAYEVEPYQIRQNFRNNRERFVEGKHFFIITSGELKEFRLQVESFYSQISPKVRALTLWTERGAARNAKMLDSDRAWDVFELLEETFFRVVRPAPSPTPDDFTGTLSITPSTTEDRKPLRALVGSWAQVSGLPFAACWNQLKAAFNLANIKELPQEWIPDAIDWVQKRIDALPAPAPATALPAAPSSPADEAEDHLAAIREHIRQIHRHEEALFLLARRALPAVRKPGDMFSPARRMGLNALQSMEDCSGALDYSLRALESATRTMLALGR
ncbi:ORF6N domain-containing protein [Desulfovibrio piger]|uniref:ORF6N domain-containing protein n=1 Tax=Desulfovibrio piger TaxID=901 RepID=UPI0026EF5DAD|nr:ORF6N domain-containing protein [Desulfovibrio piger]